MSPSMPLRIRFAMYLGKFPPHLFGCVLGSLFECLLDCFPGCKFVCLFESSLVCRIDDDSLASFTECPIECRIENLSQYPSQCDLSVSFIARILHSASSRARLLRGAPNSSTTKLNHLKLRNGSNFYV